uniref:non-specific serine/threonine protein kinase n=1 Tax=Solanum lycopersicum TaxID=4081 RepID=Q0KIH4_SOLLC|nr:Serine/threonine-protein kinase AtPK19, related [Solanum lycopersicum]
MAFAAQQKKAIHSMLANKLTHLKIPDSSSSSSPPPTDPDFDFSDVFGAPTSPSSSSSFLTDPQIIHSRSHSFVGPSPRITLSKPLPFHQEVDSEGESDSDKVNTHVGTHQTECSDGIEEISGDEGSAVTKFGPGDFEILRMIGKGSFGKVFQVKMKGYGGEGEGDGILAMKVMRKDTVIKNNHVDYMRAERDILTKVEHPFIVQLRYSFQGYLGENSASTLRDLAKCYSSYQSELMLLVFLFHKYLTDEAFPCLSLWGKAFHQKRKLFWESG